MTSEVEQRLAAILAADVAGYSRLMGGDERATVATLNEYRQIIRGHIEANGGRVVDMAGDSVLAVFKSALGAAVAAVDLQRALAERNDALPDNRRMLFRVGVNLGDLIEQDDGTVYGDGVNVAARLEGLATPGTVVISEAVRQPLRGRPEFVLEDIGEQSVKNIAQPVHAYVLGRADAEQLIEAPAGGAVKGSRQRQRLVIAIALSVASIGAIVWYLIAPGPPSRSPGQVAESGLALPDKPSIVVLPFVNMSGDSEQEFFSDGFTETITTDLSKLSNLFVISRSSAFTYKGRQVDVRDVGRELGVRYVLEGSIQRAGDNIRINAQLIDATTAEHLWGQRFDRPYADLFALQDEITQKIVTELDVRLVEGEQARMWRGITQDVAAYEISMKAIELFRRGTPEANEQAKHMFQDLIDRFGDDAAVLAGLGWAYMNEFRFGWAVDPQESFVRAMKIAEQSVAMDDTVAISHALLGFTLLLRGQHDEALAEIERSIALEPNSSLFFAIHAQTLIYAGAPDQALVNVQTAMRLSPFYPAWYLSILALAHHDNGRFEESLAVTRDYIDRHQPGLQHLAHIMLVMAHHGLGQHAQARKAAREVLRIRPDFSLAQLPRIHPYRDPATIERMRQTLRDAGLGGGAAD